MSGISGYQVERMRLLPEENRRRPVREGRGSNSQVPNARKNYKLSKKCNASLLPHKVLLTKCGCCGYFSVWMLASEDFCKIFADMKIHALSCKAGSEEVTILDSATQN